MVKLEVISLAQVQDLSPDFHGTPESIVVGGGLVVDVCEVVAVLTTRWELVVAQLGRAVERQVNVRQERGSISEADFKYDKAMSGKVDEHVICGGERGRSGSWD